MIFTFSEKWPRKDRSGGIWRTFFKLLPKWLYLESRGFRRGTALFIWIVWLIDWGPVNWSNANWSNFFGGWRNHRTIRQSDSIDNQTFFIRQSDIFIRQSDNLIILVRQSDTCIRQSDIFIRQFQEFDFFRIFWFYFSDNCDFTVQRAKRAVGHAFQSTTDLPSCAKR